MNFNLTFPWTSTATDVPSHVQCLEKELRKKLANMQNLKEAMDRHSDSACMIGWIMLAFSIFGILSNSLSLRVFTHDTMRIVPVNVLLAGLSCIDLFLSILVLPVFVAPALNLYYRWKTVDQSLPYVMFVLYPLTLMTQSASVWVFLVITCERWAAVCRPLQARRYSSVSNAKKAFIMVCIMAVLYNLVRFGEFRIVPFQQHAKDDTLTDPCSQKNFELTSMVSISDHMTNFEMDTEIGSGFGLASDLLKTMNPDIGSGVSEDPNSATVEPDIGSGVGSGSGLGTFTTETPDMDMMNTLWLEPRLRYDSTYMFLYYFGLYLITHFIVPFLILLIVNISVVWTILMSRAQRRSLTRHERREHRIALMMGVVVLTFLLCNTIPFAMNLVEAIDREIFRRPETLYMANLANDIGNLLVVVNSATTWFIYYAFSQRYRRRCVSNLCILKKKKASLQLNGRELSFKASFHETVFDAIAELYHLPTANDRRMSRRSDPAAR